MAQDATLTSVTLRWTAPGDDDQSGKAARYDIRYSRSPITASNWLAAATVRGVVSPQSAGSSESFQVGGLKPSTTFYFAIKAVDEAINWSVMSNVAEKSTIDGELPSAICGDINGDQSGPDIADLTALVNYLFLDGFWLPYPEAADLNHSGDCDIADLTYMVNFLFLTGAVPVCW